MTMQNQFQYSVCNPPSPTLKSDIISARSLKSEFSHVIQLTTPEFKALGDPLEP